MARDSNLLQSIMTFWMVSSSNLFDIFGCVQVVFTFLGDFWSSHMLKFE